MASTQDPVTEDEVITAIRKLVKNGDPTKVTNRTLMNDIEQMFGERLGPLQERLKAIVRAQTKAFALNPDLLKDVSEEKAKENGSAADLAQEKPSEVVKDSSVVEQNDKKEVENTLEANGESGAKDNSKDEAKDKKADVVQDDVKDEDGKVETVENLQSTTKREKSENVEGDTEPKSAEQHAKESESRKEHANEDEDGDEEFKINEDDDAEEEEESGITKKRRRPKAVKEEYDSDEEPLSTLGRKRRVKRTSTKDKVQLTKAEADVKKYLKLCRELGCRFPVGKFKGVTQAREKAKLLEEFLKEKGVDVKGERMTQGRIREVRKRLDRESELAGLDSGNIISEGRAKRRRTTVSYADKDEDEEVEDGEKSPPPPSPQRDSDSEEYKEESDMEEEDDD